MLMSTYSYYITAKAEKKTKQDSYLGYYKHMLCYCAFTLFFCIYVAPLVIFSIVSITLIATLYLYTIIMKPFIIVIYITAICIAASAYLLVMTALPQILFTLASMLTYFTIHYEIANTSLTNLKIYLNTQALIINNTRNNILSILFNIYRILYTTVNRKKKTSLFYYATLPFFTPIIDDRFPQFQGVILPKALPSVVAHTSHKTTMPIPVMQKKKNNSHIPIHIDSVDAVNTIAQDLTTKSLRTSISTLIRDLTAIIQNPATNYWTMLDLQACRNQLLKMPTTIENNNAAWDLFLHDCLPHLHVAHAKLTLRQLKRQFTALNTLTPMQREGLLPHPETIALQHTKSLETMIANSKFLFAHPNPKDNFLNPVFVKELGNSLNDWHWQHFQIPKQYWFKTRTHFVFASLRWACDPCMHTYPGYNMKTHLFLAALYATKLNIDTYSQVPYTPYTG